MNMQSETHSPQQAAGLVSESDESNLPYGDSPWLGVSQAPLPAARSFNTKQDNKKIIQSARGKFIAMAATYCLGVFNDNYFKQAAMLVAVSAGLSRLQGTATVLFALPFILFSAYAGWFADRYSKKNVVVGVKALELVAMIIGAVGIISGNWICILGMVFLMGLQSSFFSPALNGSIPELYPHEYVPKANAILKLTTTLSILAGIATAGLSLDQNWFQVGDFTFGKVLVAMVVVITAFLGFMASFGVHKRPAAAPDKPFPWFGPINSLHDFYETRKDGQLFLAIISDAYFYFLASIAVLTINTLGLKQLGFSQTVTSLLSMSLMIGICVGSVIAARITTMDKWSRVLFPAATGMAVGIMLAGMTPKIAGGFQLVWFSTALISTGICGGLFIIPVASFLQVRPASSDKGRILATSNFCGFIGILVSGTIFSTLDVVMAPAAVMNTLGVFAAFAAAVFFLVTRESNLIASIFNRVLKFFIGLRYSVEVKGLDLIPEKNEKGIIFLPNHPALIDPVICMSVLYDKFRPRPLVDSDQGSKPVVKAILKSVRPIMIPDLQKNGRDSRHGITQAMAEVVRGLEGGDNIILYPAGRLYRSAKEDLSGNSGVEYILGNVPDLQVVLVRTTGLWGSSFGFAGGVAPSLFGQLKRYLSAILLNGIFFGPRRRISIEIILDNTLKSLPDRLAINEYLETFYNKGWQANTHVPYFWWQGNKPQILPEPQKQSFAGDASRVPVTTQKLVKEKIMDLVGVSEIKGSDRLAHDLGVDSLSLMELAVWLEGEFGMSSLDDMSSLTTVNDCILAASGQVFEKKQTELKPVLDKWYQKINNRTRSFPQGATITSVFLAQARKSPKAIVLADQLSGAKSYRDLLTAIFALKPDIEKIKGARVGVMLPASVTAGSVYLATLFSGKTPVMINWTVGAGNMKHCLKETGVTHIISAKALYAKLSGQGLDLDELGAQWLFVDELAARMGWMQKLSAVLRATVMPSSLQKIEVPATATILFTSGSESMPKVVPLTHRNILANIQDFTKVLSFDGNDRMLGMLPPFHSLGLVGTIILPLCLGIKTVYHHNPTEAVTLARLIDHYQVSVMIGTPTFLSGIVSVASKEQLSTLRLLFTGAEKCPQHVYDAFHAMCPKAVLCEGYGITECSPLVSVNHVDDPRPGTIGRVLSSIDYVIIHPEKDLLVEKGEQGLLLVRGPNIFGGYLNKDTGQGFYEFDGKTWYQTGDFVSEDEDGILTFCGRKKRFIKLGGEMISLPAIEAALHKFYPAADDNGPTLAVEATPTEEHPEIVLFTTLDINREEVNRTIREAGLSALHNIRKLENIDIIPVLGTGKTDYKQLQERLN
ncbi:MAG: MFS transporter [Proteobacteria bacterium]|nr:MFS transporter [Pseudomonadota bacterium]MBU1716669.1 MFS transporter [Pseudomonadota bacterium]